jgi:periplasmic copper chaperone A
MHIPSLAGSATLAVLLLGSFAQAREVKAGALVIHDPWTRATPKGATVAAGYGGIENSGSVPDRLVGGSLADSTGFEIHSMSSENGVMSMRAVEGGLVIAPGSTLALAPSGLHLMFPKLRRQLTKGEMIEGTLVFEKAGRVPVEFAVEALDAKAGIK